MEHTELVKPATLDDLIQTLHRVFDSDCINVAEVEYIMEAYESNPQEWMKYAKFDHSRYTRNLVDEGNGKFNLILLCWVEGQGCGIHDHTDSHCFVKMVQGELKETRFHWPDAKSQGAMVQKSQRIIQENKVAYINDNFGLHRVENGSHTERAVSLHLYSPPYQTCQIFDQRTGHSHTKKLIFNSKHGEKTPFESTISQENN